MQVLYKLPCSFGCKEIQLKYAVSIVLELSKIESVEQLRLVKESDFGFIVFSDEVSKTAHRSACESITEEKFAGSNGVGFDWFSTLNMAEKSSGLALCKSCKPAD